MRMSGGLRSIAARSFWGVSPVRMPTLMSPPIPRSGARRLRSMSYESAFSGETYTSRVVRSPSGGGVATRRSSPQRNAASVLPEPVGADSSTSSPRAIAGHACSWAAVGRSKARRNHSRTCGVNDSRAAEGMRPFSVTKRVRRSPAAHPALLRAIGGGTRRRRDAYYCRTALQVSLPVVQLSFDPSLALPVDLSENLPCAFPAVSLPETWNVFFEPSFVPVYLPKTEKLRSLCTRGPVMSV